MQVPEEDAVIYHRDRVRRPVPEEKAIAQALGMIRVWFVFPDCRPFGLPCQEALSQPGVSMKGSAPAPLQPAPLTLGCPTEGMRTLRMHAGHWHALAVLVPTKACASRERLLEFSACAALRPCTPAPAQAARHPLLVIGAGANRKMTSNMLRQFVDAVGMPFCDTQQGKGVIDSRERAQPLLFSLPNPPQQAWPLGHLPQEEACSTRLPCLMLHI